ncbi:conserved hypothetical protein [Hyella patelloides LEGE 07179]|uniref:Uncharacterized protein n=2 Tax=Hyella TaxID=945733 RepID=A0A563VTP7_9CYAN|nr:conserved hypothetical protein [Hyella patelloides LEGE 07179]
MPLEIKNLEAQLRYTLNLELIIMTQTKIQGKFYPLKSDEWLESIKQLTFSELKILYYVRALDPYNKGINLTPAQIAKDLSTEDSQMHRSTVGRALKSLEKKGFLKMELLQVRIKVNPQGFLSEEKTADVVTTQRNCEQTTHDASPQQNVPPHNIECSQATKCAPTQQSSAENQSEQGFQISKTLKTYLDFKDSLSEEEREKFLLFVKEQIKDFARPINDLEAWLASNTKSDYKRPDIILKK